MRDLLPTLPMPRWLAATTVLIGLVAAFTSPADAGDDWRQFRGGPEQRGLAEELPDQLKPVWTFKAQDAIEATAAIADGVVYVASLDGTLYALDLTDGKLKWKVETGEEIKSSPLVSGGMVYFGDEAGVLHAVDAKTGAERWTFTVDGPISGSANLSGDCLVFGSYDNFLYCVDPKDGKKRWQVETDGYVHGTPAIVDGTAISSGCDGQLRQISLADGSLVHQVKIGSYVAASPAVAAGRAFVGTFDNSVLAVDLGGKAGSEARVAWEYRHAEREFPFYSSAAVTDKAVILGGRDKMVHALDPQTGKALWTRTFRARVDASPVVSGKRVYVADDSGVLAALAIASGEEVWRFEASEGFTASPAIASGHLVIGALDGRVYGFAGS